MTLPVRLPVTVFPYTLIGSSAYGSSATIDFGASTGASLPELSPPQETSAKVNVINKANVAIMEMLVFFIIILF